MNVVRRMNGPGMCSRESLGYLVTQAGSGTDPWKCRRRQRPQSAIATHVSRKGWRSPSWQSVCCIESDAAYDSKGENVWLCDEWHDLVPLPSDRRVLSQDATKVGHCLRPVDVCSCRTEDRYVVIEQSGQPIEIPRSNGVLKLVENPSRSLFLVGHALDHDRRSERGPEDGDDGQRSVSPAACDRRQSR